MRREFIEFPENLPMKVSYSSYKSYPIHWHNAMEIIYVIEGKITVNIETETHILGERQIEIVNSDEAHSIYSNSKNNKVLIFSFDIGFLNRYYDIKNIFFYTETSGNNVQRARKYEELREYLAVLLCEMCQKNEDYEEYIEENLVLLLYHLINNFHYLIYDEESLKDKEVQFERYNRIIKYIYSNYYNKISLQDIANREYLSSHYLSYGIKNNVGYGFNDFLNQTRVEEAIKLLLDTDKTISEISEELGFSHTRYFNKHFKKHYKCTPMQYRKKHELSLEEYEAKKQFDNFPTINALDFFANYLENYPRFVFEDRIIKINIDLSNCIGGELSLKGFDTIYLGHCKDLLSQKKRSLIEDSKRDLNFKYGLIKDIFLVKDDKLAEYGNQLAYWEEIREVFDSFLELNIIPRIIFEKDKIELDAQNCLMEAVIDYYRGFFGDNAVREWSFCSYDDLGGKPDFSLNTLYDTSYMVPLIIDDYINKNNYPAYITLFDEFGKDEIDNAVFYGGNGIINKYGIKKPLYYAYYFISLLGKNVIDKGEGYIITEKDGDYQLLLYSYDKKMKEFIMKGNAYKKLTLKGISKQKYSINLASLSDDFRVIIYSINQKNGASYDNWISMGAPKVLNEKELDLLNMASRPSVRFHKATKSPVYNIQTTVDGYGATMILLQKVQKHL